MKRQSDDNRVKAISLTIKFNQGWCLEQLKDVAAATEIYKAIIAEEPTYTDAYLRLSLLAKSSGDVKRALQYAEEARENHIKKPGYQLPTNIIAFKASLHESFGQMNEATKEYDHAK